jgi:hypothetical protein
MSFLCVHPTGSPALAASVIVQFSNHCRLPAGRKLPGTQGIGWGRTVSLASGSSPLRNTPAADLWGISLEQQPRRQAARSFFFWAALHSTKGQQGTSADHPVAVVHASDSALSVFLSNTRTATSFHCFVSFIRTLSPRTTFLCHPAILSLSPIRNTRLFKQSYLLVDSYFVVEAGPSTPSLLIPPSPLLPSRSTERRESYPFRHLEIELRCPS